MTIHTRRRILTILVMDAEEEAENIELSLLKNREALANADRQKNVLEQYRRNLLGHKQAGPCLPASFLQNVMFFAEATERSVEQSQMACQRFITAISRDLEKLDGLHLERKSLTRAISKVERDAAIELDRRAALASPTPRFWPKED